MIEIKNITKYYGQKKVLDNISFTVNKGEVLGFLGVNGAGKTTTMNIITGYITPSVGTVSVSGIDVLENPNEVKKRIGYLPEMPPLYNDMTVNEYLRFVSEIKYVEKGKIESEIETVLNQVNLGDVKYRLIKNLSKGYKQRVGLAQALIGSPDVLIFDEPTVGLDPVQIREIRNLIRSLSENRTIILSSHIMQEVSAICSRILIIDKGVVIAEDSPEDLIKGFSVITVKNFEIEGDESKVYESLNSVSGVSQIKTVEKVGENIYKYQANIEGGNEVLKKVFFSLAENKLPIFELSEVDVNLEDIFLKLISERNEISNNEVQVREDCKTFSDDEHPENNQVNSYTEHHENKEGDSQINKEENVETKNEALNEALNEKSNIDKETDKQVNIKINKEENKKGHKKHNEKNQMEQDKNSDNSKENNKGRKV